MRDFHTVVGIDLMDVLNGRHDVTVCGIVAFQFIGDEPARFTALAVDQAAKEADRSILIASLLHENINGIAVLIHGTPEIVALALDRDKYFVEMPGIAQAALVFFQSPRIRGAKLQAPLSNGFIRHRDATFS